MVCWGLGGIQYTVLCVGGIHYDLIWYAGGIHYNVVWYVGGIQYNVWYPGGIQYAAKALLLCC